MKTLSNDYPKDNMTKSQIFGQAVREYGIGLYARGLFPRFLAPLLGMVSAVFLLLGMLDTLSAWHLRLPLWLHIVSTSVFALALAASAKNHFGRTRATGREYLRERA